MDARFHGSAPRQLGKVGLDVAVYVVAITLAYVLRFERWPTGSHASTLMVLMLLLPLARVVVGRRLGIDRTAWRLFGLRDASRLVLAVAVVSGVLLAFRIALPRVAAMWPEAGGIVVPLGVIALEAFFAAGLTIGLRCTARLLDERTTRTRLQSNEADAPRRAVLVGAGRAGAMAARELRNRPDAGFVPRAFVDDDPTRAGLLVEGVPVDGRTHDVVAVARAADADTVILTMPSAPRRVIRAVVERCRAGGLQVQTVPGYYELIGGQVGIETVRPIRIEDLLGRGVVQMDEAVRGQVDAAFAGKRVLVTGAGGSIGSELCRQLQRGGVRSLVLVEASENNLFDIEQELRADFEGELVACLADVRDGKEIEAIFAEHRPQVVFHAAAYKHVPMMEGHPSAAISNNVAGTRVVAEAADRHRAERFLLVSTDKAVNPSSVMGASKRVAEMVVHGLDRSSATRFCAVRFGNVLGSRGSVLHTFQQQIERGGPVTVTDRDITRFFMTIPEAARLLLVACAIGDGGEIFLLDMGEPVRIVDLARDMIRLAGLDASEIEIEIVGLRPGEKLHEELLHRGEDARPSAAQGIMLATADGLDHVDLAPWLDRLEDAAEQRDVPTIRQMLASGAGYRSPARRVRAASDYLDRDPRSATG